MSSEKFYEAWSEVLSLSLEILRFTGLHGMNRPSEGTEKKSCVKNRV